MRKVIIIPTYNEIENIEVLINKIFSNPELSGIHILVVDDNSPDGTAAAVHKLIKSRWKNQLFILEREKKDGLASAYIAGFNWGLAKDYEVFIEMDADLSHNPDYLSHMIEMARQYDCVIGSRYIKNGSVVGWGLIRKIISKGGSLYSRLVLNTPINDFTGGFNLWSRKVLQSIGIDQIISRGYLFQIELKYRAYQKGYKIIEVPICFEDRLNGKSKMSKKIVLEAMFNIWQLKGINF